MIGGNVEGLLQSLTTSENEIGEAIESYQTIATLTGFLDFMGETTNKTNYQSKIVEATHIFICDYVAIDTNAENKRMAVNNEEYVVKYIDNPMGLNQHLEIYLKYVGGQNG